MVIFIIVQDASDSDDEAVVLLLIITATCWQVLGATTKYHWCLEQLSTQTGIHFDSSIWTIVLLFTISHAPPLFLDSTQRHLLLGAALIINLARCGA